MSNEDVNTFTEEELSTPQLAKKAFLITEFKLIWDKKSTLSRTKRDAVSREVLAYLQKGWITEEELQG